MTAILSIMSHFRLHPDVTYTNNKYNKYSSAPPPSWFPILHLLQYFFLPSPCPQHLHHSAPNTFCARICQMEVEQQPVALRHVTPLLLALFVIVSRLCTCTTL